MYFANDAHKENYQYLMNLYRLSHAEDVQYEANIYIAAYPRIFKCFNVEGISTGSGPLVGLEDEEFAKRYGHRLGPLTSSAREMVDFGMSLYNSSKVCLDDVFGLVTDDEGFNVLMQAIKIRTKRP